MKPALSRLKAMISTLLLLLSPFLRKGGGKKTAPGLMSRTDPWSVWGRNKYPMVVKWILVVLTIVSLTMTGPNAMADIDVTTAIINGNTVLSVKGTLNTSLLQTGGTYAGYTDSVVYDNSALEGGNGVEADYGDYTPGTGFVDWSGATTFADATTFGPGYFVVSNTALFLTTALISNDIFTIDSSMTFNGKTPTDLTWVLSPFQVAVGGDQYIKFFYPTGPTVEEQTLESANSTGVPMSNYNVSSVNNITTTVLGGLHNARIVRARSHLSNPRLIDTHSWVAADRALPNYLNFAANQGITMRQALGLEDVPVSSSVAGGSAPLMMGLSVGYSKEPIDPKAPLEAPDRWELYAVGDIGDVDQDALDVVNRGYRNRTYAGSIGAEYLVSDRLNVGTAFSYADSDTDFAENLGSADIEGQLGSVYATYFKDGAYVDALYSYGAFDHELIRNTGNGNAFGNTDSDAHTFALNAGKNFAYNGLVTGPTVGIDHTTGTVDAYTETGALPLNFFDRDFESTISSLGWQVSKTKKVNSGLVTVQGSASWDHEYQPEGGVVSGSLVVDPTIPFNGVGAGPGTDWLNLGLGLRLLTNSGIDIELDYQTQVFRDDVAAHYGGLKFSTKF